ncbi:MAG: sulfite exporter TauE/SafE family protein [Thermoanaerobacterales bacterium]|nr:sulfite exporter TauE/SafE family protein [Bacillota bacterium]MDI6905942.1 sulfite exporter TauE/SafE family protein [Thermoanaerobacterales bacterium]
MSLYLAVAGIAVNPLAVLGLAATAGTLSGLFGTGGGFLLTPLLMFLGIPPAVAAASGCNQIVASSCTGALAHKRLGNVDVKMGLIFLSGAVLGGAAGAQVVRILRGLGHYDDAVKAVYVVMLALIGAFMLRESLQARQRPSGGPGFTTSRIKGLLARLPLQTEFRVSGIRTSILFIVGLGFFAGFLAATLGVGGGFITIPVMIYLLGVPTLVAVGTGLFQIVFTGISVTFQQALTNHTVDLVLAVVLFGGAAIGAQIGARIARFFRAQQIRLFLAVAVLAVMAGMMAGLLSPPETAMTIVRAGGGH